MIDRIKTNPFDCAPDEFDADDSDEPSTPWYAEHVAEDEGICDGRPVIKGTQIPVRTIIANLARGDTAEDLIRNFPALTEADIRAAVGFANDKDGTRRRVILSRRYVNGFPVEVSVLPGRPYRFTRPTEAEKLVARPEHEPVNLADLVGTWPGDIDDGFEDWVRARRAAARQKKWFPF